VHSWPVLQSPSTVHCGAKHVPLAHTPPEPQLSSTVQALDGAELPPPQAMASTAAVITNTFFMFPSHRRLSYLPMIVDDHEP